MYASIMTSVWADNVVDNKTDMTLDGHLKVNYDKKKCVCVQDSTVNNKVTERSCYLTLLVEM